MSASSQSRSESVIISAPDGKKLHGIVTCPLTARGLILFAHGSGSSRFSPRNRLVATVLEESSIATLLFDLLTAAEEDNRALVFDIDFLTKRLLSAAAWVKKQPKLAALPLGFFGASTGAAAALSAAAQLSDIIFAVVSRGGRPDLAGRFLSRVQAPTLLIVGGADDEVLELNRQALKRLACEKRLAVIPGATHLFEEPGALEEVAKLAQEWFVHHLHRYD